MRIRNILARRLLPLAEFDVAVTFHEQLLGQVARLRFAYPEKSLSIAQVGSILFIGGDDASLRPFIETAMTFLVENLDDYARSLPNLGATIVRPTQDVPSGRNMLVRHPDGMLVEYV